MARWAVTQQGRTPAQPTAVCMHGLVYSATEVAGVVQHTAWQDASAVAGGLCRAWQAAAGLYVSAAAHGAASSASVVISSCKQQRPLLPAKLHRAAAVLPFTQCMACRPARTSSSLQGNDPLAPQEQRSAHTCMPITAMAKQLLSPQQCCGLPWFANTHLGACSAVWCSCPPAVPGGDWRVHTLGLCAYCWRW